MRAVRRGSTLTMREEPGPRDARTKDGCSVAGAPSLSRRRLILGSLTVLVVPRVLCAQPMTKAARVGILASSTEENFAPSVKVFREALRTAGWVEGQNLTLEVRYAGERYAQLPELAAELVRLKVDVIASLGTPATEAAKRATTTIPIVMESLADVVSTGLVSNLARPGGNVTGLSGFAPELSGKRLELIREIQPSAVRIAMLANLANPATAQVIRATQSAAQQMRMRLNIVDVRQPGALDAAFDTMTRARNDAFVLAGDPLLFSLQRRIIDLASRHRLPAVYETRVFVEKGGLLSYGPLTHERFARMALYVDRILRGAQPGDLPVEQPSTFELVLNLKTAKSLGLAIPRSLRLRADHVIE
jgi:putative tryptophan/tyrosine transport system substrate-binding protein